MDDPTSEAIRTGIEKKIGSFAEGVLEHATDMLTEVWEIVSKDGDIMTHENTPSTVRLLHLCLVHCSVFKSVCIAPAGCAGSELSSLGVREDGPYQVHS